jgi:hypothetical protein
MTVKGAIIASAVAGMFAAAVPAVANAKGEAKVKCMGVNSCKTKGECGTKDHSCAGQNACQGKGWISVTEKECKDKKGTILK